MNTKNTKFRDQEQLSTNTKMILSVFSKIIFKNMNQIGPKIPFVFHIFFLYIYIYIIFVYLAIMSI